jgi:hypothetical protein
LDSQGPNPLNIAYGGNVPEDMQHFNSGPCSNFDPIQCYTLSAIATDLILTSSPSWAPSANCQAYGVALLNGLNTGQVYQFGPSPNGSLMQGFGRGAPNQTNWELQVYREGIVSGGPSLYTAVATAMAQVVDGLTGSDAVNAALTCRAAYYDQHGESFY